MNVLSFAHRHCDMVSLYSTLLFEQNIRWLFCCKVLNRLFKLSNCKKKKVFKIKFIFENYPFKYVSKLYKYSWLQGLVYLSHVVVQINYMYEYLILQENSITNFNLSTCDYLHYLIQFFKLLFSLLRLKMLLSFLYLNQMEK